MPNNEALIAVSNLRSDMRDFINEFEGKLTNHQRFMVWQAQNALQFLAESIEEGDREND